MDLTGLPALDLAIGLSFVFLLLSLLASAAQEAIAQMLALRSRTLLDGVRNMLEDETPTTDPRDVDRASVANAVAPPTTTPTEPGDAPASPTGPGDAPASAGLEPDTSRVEKGIKAAEGLTNLVYAHPLIKSSYTSGLFRSRLRLPSYIAPRSFALALVDTLAPEAAKPNADGTPRESKDVIAATRRYIVGLKLPQQLSRPLLAILDDARGDVDAFRSGIEAWFDDTMARVSGWYKRQAQFILICLGIVVVLALNANTITIGERLWQDPNVRATVVEQAAATVGKPKPATQDKSATEQLQAAARDVEDAAKLGIPLGWTSDDDDPRMVKLTSWEFFYRDLLGWLLTVAAISLGAPFWFDTLSRLSRLRSTGKPEAPLPASGYGKSGERVRA